MPICKHLKPLAECRICQPDPWAHISPGLTDPDAPTTTVKRVAKKVIEKLKPKGKGKKAKPK